MTFERQGWHGTDAFGDILATGGPCDVCGHTPNVVVRYTDKITLPRGIDRDCTIFRLQMYYVGILCGCYAKFHRQVAHIEDRQKAKK